MRIKEKHSHLCVSEFWFVLYVQNALHTKQNKQTSENKKIRIAELKKKNGNLNEQQQLLYYNCHGMDVDKWSRDESAMCEDVDGEWCLLSV